MKAVLIAGLTALVLHPGLARAQTVSAEAVQTVGGSSEGLSAAATQVRAFGDVLSGTRFNIETAWGSRFGFDGESDAFGSAYPYAKRVQVIEAYGERTFRPHARLLALHAGRFRPPFGIFAGSDHAYTGFLRAPLIRYDDYFALSNTFLENGASVVAGTPSLYVETALGTPADVGDARRPRGLDRVVRLQGAYRSLIVGVSYISTRPYQSPFFAHGRAEFGGIDARWMRSGFELRGEWIGGQPFDGTRTTGGYADLLVHRPGLGPVTAVLRAERLAYAAGPRFSMYAHRYTTGARVRVLNTLSAQVNVLTQRGVPESRRSALDVGLTYVYRFDSHRSK